MKTNIYKSIGVIILAFVVCATLSILTDFLLESIGVLPESKYGLFGTGNILLVLFYRGIYNVCAGFTVAKFSPNKPMLHALILGVFGTGITLLASSNPDIAEKSEPWFGYTLAVITIPCILLGVKIQQNWNQ